MEEETDSSGRLLYIKYGSADGMVLWVPL